MTDVKHDSVFVIFKKNTDNRIIVNFIIKWRFPTSIVNNTSVNKIDKNIANLIKETIIYQYLYVDYFYCYL